MNVLQQLLIQVKELEESYRQQLPQEDGLLLRPALSLNDHAKAVKLKYKLFRNRTHMYTSLVKKNSKGDSKYKCRFGKKAQQLRSEVINFNHVLYTRTVLVDMLLPLYILAID